MSGVLLYTLFGLDVILTVSAQLMLRLGATRLGDTGLSFAILLEPIRNMYILGGLLTYGVSFFLYFFILSKIQLNVVFPIATGATLILITLFSHFFLKESLVALQLFGIALILVGIFLVLMPK